VLEAIGLRLSVGAECTIELPPGSTLPYAQAEVVGFSGERLFLMPTTDVAGVLPGARVWPLEAAPVADPLAGAKRLPVGWEMLGRVVDASGRPLDGLGPLAAKVDAPLSAPSINPLDREPIITCSTSACARSTACSPSAAASAWACSRLRRRQVGAARHDGALHERRRDRDRADRRTRPRSEGIHRAHPRRGRPRALGRRRGAGRRVAAAADAGRRLCDARRIFPRPGQARAAADGFADALRDGAARDRAGDRRAARDQGLSAVGVREAAALVERTGNGRKAAARSPRSTRC
jgi:hypothetical protein